MDSYFPPLGFHFSVEFSKFKSEYQFQSVSGLNIDLETEEIGEGGENRFKHKLPVKTKYPNLVLKRGLLTDSEIVKWCLKGSANLSIEPTNLMVMLLDENHNALLTWKIIHAYPVKWNIADFNAEESKLVIETIELAYSYFEII